MGSVAVENGGVAGTDLTGVVEDDDLGVEGRGLLGGVVLGVRGDVATTDILDRDVPKISWSIKDCDIQSYALT